MGTHPIFESDFDCLTETMSNPKNKTKWGAGPIGWENEWTDENEAKRHHRREMFKIEANREVEMERIAAEREVGLAQVGAHDKLADNMRYLGQAINRACDELGDSDRRLR